MPFVTVVQIPIAPPILFSASFALRSRIYPFIEQQTDNWCWVACVAMVEAALRGSARSQCKIAGDEMGISGCCSSPNFQACDSPANLAGVTLALKSVRPSTAITSPLSKTWLLAQLSLGAVAALWQWDDSSDGPANHLVLVVGARALGPNDHAFIVHDPWLSDADELSFGDLMTARGLGRWIFAWTNL